MKATLVAAGAGVVLSPSIVALTPAAGLSPPQCSQPSTVICVATELEVLRNQANGANQVHAIAQTLAASTTPTPTFEFLGKLYAKTASIRNPLITNYSIATLTYHY